MYDMGANCIGLSAIQRRPEVLRDARECEKLGSRLTVVGDWNIQVHGSPARTASR